MTLHRVAQLADLPEDRGTCVTLATGKILLVRLHDQVRAFQAECPHAGAPLADGAICNGRLICPWHKASFAIDDGTLCEPPALDDLRRYSAHVVDGEVYVDDSLVPVTDSASVGSSVSSTAGAQGDSRTFVVVGGGAAGTAAAAALRDQGFAGRLVLIDAQRQPDYDRTALSKFVLAGQQAAHAVPALRDETFYQEQHIERIHGSVTTLATNDRRITLADGRTFDFDAALLATGGQAQRLNVQGNRLAGVFTLRSRDDAQQIMQAARPKQRAVLIGDGFIGLEAAAALTQHGLSVTVLARHEVPFARQFGERVGRAIRELHERNGVVYRKVGEVLRFIGVSGRVQAVVLDDGKQVPADLVILATGVTPATGFVSDLPMTEDGGLTADAGLQVAPAIWAAGDIASFPLQGAPQRIEHWRVAQQQARIAASNMLGSQEAYTDIPFFWTFHFGQRLDYLGHAKRWDQEIFEGDLATFEFSVLFCQGDRVVAVVACKRERALAWFAQRLRQPLSIAEASARLRQH